MRKINYIFALLTALIFASCTVEPPIEIRTITSAANYDFIYKSINATNHPVEVRLLVGKIKDDNFITLAVTEKTMLQPYQAKEYALNTNDLSLLGKKNDEIRITCEVTNYGAEYLGFSAADPKLFDYETESWDSLWTFYTNYPSLDNLKGCVFSEAIRVDYFDNTEGGKTVYPYREDWYFEELTPDRKPATNPFENTIVVLPYNLWGPNYQVGLNTFDNLKLREGDKIKVTIKGSVRSNSMTPYTIPPVCVSIVDLCEAGDYWTPISNIQILFSEPIEPESEFIEEIILDVNKDPISNMNSDIKLVLKHEMSDLNAPLIITDCTITVDRL